MPLVRDRTAISGLIIAYLSGVAPRSLPRSAFVIIVYWHQLAHYDFCQGVAPDFWFRQWLPLRFIQGFVVSRAGSFPSPLTSPSRCCWLAFIWYWNFKPAAGYFAISGVAEEQKFCTTHAIVSVAEPHDLRVHLVRIRAEAGGIGRSSGRYQICTITRLYVWNQTFFSRTRVVGGGVSFSSGVGRTMWVGGVNGNQILFLPVIKLLWPEAATSVSASVLAIHHQRAIIIYTNGADSLQCMK